VRPQTALLAVGLILVAALSYLFGYSRPRRAPVSAEDIVYASVEARAAQEGKRIREAAKAKGSGAVSPKRKEEPVPIPGIAHVPAPKATPVAEGAYRNDALGLTISKPEGDAWAMTSDRASFRDPIRHPAKLLEMRRDPKDGTSKYAVIELFDIPVPDEAHAREQIEQFERFGGRGEKTECKLLGEGKYHLSGHLITRRMSSFKWNETARETRLVSISTLVKGRLVLLLAFADTRYFDAILPEFDQAFATLELD